MMSSKVSESPAKYGRDPRISDDDEPWLEKRFWTESEYLALETNHLIEFNNGELEILPMPDFPHQSIALFFARLIEAFAAVHKPGIVVIAPFRLKISNGKYREPDVIFLYDEHADKFGDSLWTGADLVLEIVSPGGRKRDTMDKRADYAVTGIPEYWIVDPKHQRVTVLILSAGKYVEHGVFQIGESATSVVLSGFSVAVSAIFAPRGPRKK